MTVIIDNKHGLDLCTFVPAGDTVAAEAEIRAMTPAERLAEFNRCWGFTLDNVKRMAMICRVMEESKDDLEQLPALWKDIRKVAQGQLLPDTLLEFINDKCHLQAVGSLSLLDQRRLVVAREPVKLVVRMPDGTLTHRPFPVAELKPPQLRQVIGEGRIRSETEQIAAIEAETRRTTRKRQRENFGILSIDRVRNVVVASGRGTISFQDIQACARVLRG